MAMVFNGIADACRSVAVRLAAGSGTHSCLSVIGFPCIARTSRRTDRNCPEMEQLWSVGTFLRKLRSRLRTGELSRAPLKLLRFQVQESTAECDWIARPPDARDADIAPRIREKNQTLQALRDALAVRQLLFRIMPEIKERTLPSLPIPRRGRTGIDHYGHGCARG